MCRLCDAVRAVVREKVYDQINNNDMETPDSDRVDRETDHHMSRLFRHLAEKWVEENPDV